MEVIEKTNKKNLLIPISSVQKGIEYCKVNVRGYLDDAKALLTKRRIGHAYVSVQFAIEELGKALLLKKRRAEAWKAGKWEISIEVGKEWKSHNCKAKEAWTLLDPANKILHKRIPRLEIKDTEASPWTRPMCSYVEFNESSQTWQLGPAVDVPKLESLIKNIEEVISKV